MHDTLPHNTRPPVEVTSGLKEVFDPLSFAVADGIEAAIAEGNTSRIYETAMPDVRLSFPSSREYGRLPWDVLEPLGVAELNAVQKAPAGPERNKVVKALEDAYLRKYPNTALKDEYGATTEIGWALQVELRDFLFGRPGAPKKQPLDVHSWKQYEASVAALSPNQQTAVDSMQRVRANNAANWQWHDPRIRKTDKLLYANNPHIPRHAVTGSIAVPIGEYGEEFAQWLVDSGIAMQAYAERTLGAMSTELTEGNEELLLAYTARAAEAEEATGTTTLQTLKEGILTNTQSIAILTAQKVEGYDDPYKLAADLVECGLIERLARYSPMGLVGPMALSGSYFPDCIVRTEEGKLAFSDAFEGYLKAKRSEYVARFVLDNADIIPPSGTSRPIGRICPAAGKDGGIQRLGETQVALINPLDVDAIASV